MSGLSLLIGALALVAAAGVFPASGHILAEGRDCAAPHYDGCVGIPPHAACTKARVEAPLEDIAISPTNCARYTACDTGDLTPAKLTVTLTYDDALVCDACGDELFGRRATAFLLSQRSLAPHALMSATVSRKTEGT